MRKLVPLILILLAGCKMPQKPGSKLLQDTLAIVKNKLNFKSLDSAEAYDFINKYYLPRLDTMPAKRTLLIHPLVGRNFNETLKRISADIKAHYGSELTVSKNDAVLRPSDPIGAVDEHHSWNKSRLSDVNVITDTILNPHHQYYHINSNEIHAWRKKFPHGYVIVSYPVYNSFTKWLYIKQGIVYTVGAIDGNVVEKELWFRKTNNGWQAY
jgi:hypothetical protein